MMVSVISCCTSGRRVGGTDAIVVSSILRCLGAGELSGFWSVGFRLLPLVDIKM